MNISIALSRASRHCVLYAWQTSPGALVEHALQYLVQTDADFAKQANEDWQFAVWGRPVALDHALKDGDRLEVLRPLRVDPKVARRERFQKQGAKTAGLFAKRRAGAKPGY